MIEPGDLVEVVKDDEGFNPILWAHPHTPDIDDMLCLVSAGSVALVLACLDERVLIESGERIGWVRSEYLKRVTT